MCAMMGIVLPNGCGNGYEYEATDGYDFSRDKMWVKNGCVSGYV